MNNVIEEGVYGISGLYGKHNQPGWIYAVVIFSMSQYMLMESKSSQTMSSSLSLLMSAALRALDPLMVVSKNSTKELSYMSQEGVRSADQTQYHMDVRPMGRSPPAGFNRSATNTAKD